MVPLMKLETRVVFGKDRAEIRQKMSPMLAAGWNWNDEVAEGRHVGEPIFAAALVRVVVQGPDGRVTVPMSPISIG